MRKLNETLYHLIQSNGVPVFTRNGEDKRQRKILNMLLDNPELSFVEGPASPLWSASALGKVKLVKLIMKIRALSKAKVTTFNEFAMMVNESVYPTALHWMAFTARPCNRNHARVGEILIRRWNVNAYDEEEPMGSPLRYAVAVRNVAWARFLLTHGATIIAREWKGFPSPKHVFGRSSFGSRKDLLILLLEYGLIDFKFRNELGNNLLHAFIDHVARDDTDASEIVEILADKCGISIDELDDRGSSSIDRFFRTRNLQLILFLIKRGRAEYKGKRITTKSPQSLTVGYRSNDDFLDLIASTRGADVNVVTNDGWTTYPESFIYNNERLIRLLLKKCGVFGTRTLSWFSSEIECINRSLTLTFENILVQPCDKQLILASPEALKHLRQCEDLAQMLRNKLSGPYSIFFVSKLLKNAKKLTHLVKRDGFAADLIANVSLYCYENDSQRVFKGAVRVKDRSVTIDSKLQSLLFSYFLRK